MLKRITLIVIVLVLLLPGFFGFYNKESVGKNLEGSYVPAEDPDFTWDKWWEGTYSELKNNWVNEHFAFRNTLVRLSNQIKFSLFKQSPNPDFVVGKDNYLYQLGYINQYTGQDYIGDKAIEDSVKQLKTLQDALSQINKHLLVVLAPSKARVYPEYLPVDVEKKRAAETSYTSYTKWLKQYGVNVIDFNAIFLNKKAVADYPLFPKYGVHWSRLEAIRAADTINRYFSVRTQREIPKLVIRKINASDSLVAVDKDALTLLNLLSQPRIEKVGYPEAEILDAYKSSLHVLVISDSFWWDIYDLQIPWYCFASNEFWYYNTTAYSSAWLGSKSVNELDVKKKILQNDLVLLVCAESNINRLGFGFVKGAIEALKRPTKVTEDEIQEYVKATLNTPLWYQEQVQKSKTSGIPVEKIIYEDAQWMVQTQGPVKKPLNIEGVIDHIKNDGGWVAEIKRQAIERKITEDSSLMLNARYVMDGISDRMKHKRSLEDWINEIKSSKKWLQETERKARVNGVTPEQQLTDEASYLRNQPIFLKK